MLLKSKRVGFVHYIQIFPLLGALYRYTVPELYRSITFVSDEKNLVELGVNSFVTSNTRHIKHIKELHFTARFHVELRNRCPGGDESNSPAHAQFFEALDSQLNPLFSIIEDDSLHRFRFVMPAIIESDPHADVDVAVGI